MIDVQSSVDIRNIPICQVGIKNVVHPLSFSDNDEQNTTVQSVGDFSLYVHLPKEKKGTHMSRFLSLLYTYSNKLSLNQLSSFSHDMNNLLESNSSFLSVSFPFFHKKEAPVSKTIGTIDVAVTLQIENIEGNLSQKISVQVPIKSLCPCSKAISEYGAHSQRGHITIHLWNSQLSIKDCIEIAEEAASSPIYSILKREDEKYVTEHAYNKPRFVEDLARESAYLLKEKSAGAKFEITAENFESIHNHSAWACVRSEDIQ